MQEPAPSRDPDDVVLYRVERGVAIVTLNRPDRLNAWTPELERRYVHRLRLATASPEVRVVLVTGAGRAFCAGADTKVLGDLAGRDRQNGQPDVLGPRRLPVYEFEAAVPKPVIAAVHGPCVGIGFSHALMCDLRFGSPSARFGATFARLGLPAEQGAAWLLDRLIGPSRAADLLLSGRIVGADEALRLGLVDRLAGDVLAAALDYAADIAANCSPASLATIKRQLRRAPQQDFRTAADEADELTREALRGDDFGEAVRALRERRPVSFHAQKEGETCDSTSTSGC
jgi:enoyl-CoA hydratase/carnithine racemase